MVSYDVTEIEKTLTPEEENALFKEKLKSLGIKAVLFDFDDTLIYTSEIFIKYMEQFINKVVEETNIEYDIINESLCRINNEEYKKMGVSPARWNAVVERMAKEEKFRGNENSIVNNLNILKNIYLQQPRIRPGAVATLKELKNAELKLGMVTHANEEWTWRKLESTEMGKYFDTIVIADENCHKGSEHWLTAVENLEVSPSECLVIGDNLGGDVISAASIGAKTVWLKKGSSWSVYKEGEIPADTILIDELSELLPTLKKI